MPRKGIDYCPKCKKWGSKGEINDKNQLIAKCPHCGHSWKSMSRFARRYAEKRQDALNEPARQAGN